MVHTPSFYRLGYILLAFFWVPALLWAPALRSYLGVASWSFLFAIIRAIAAVLAVFADPVSTCFAHCRAGWPTLAGSIGRFRRYRYSRETDTAMYSQRTVLKIKASSLWYASSLVHH